MAVRAYGGKEGDFPAKCSARLLQMMELTRHLHGTSIEQFGVPSVYIADRLLMRNPWRFHLCWKLTLEKAEGIWGPQSARYT